MSCCGFFVEEVLDGIIDVVELDVMFAQPVPYFLELNGDVVLFNSELLQGYEGADYFPDDAVINCDRIGP
jgi:hypothetical protein